MAATGNVGENMLIVFWILQYVNRHWCHIWEYSSSRNHLQALFTREIAKELFTVPIISFPVLQTDVCSFCLYHGENKNESLRWKCTDFHPSCSVQAWPAGWESTEWYFGPVPGSSKLFCPARVDLGWAVLLCASISTCVKSQSVMILLAFCFFFSKYFDPCCWKEPDTPLCDLPRCMG